MSWLAVDLGMTMRGGTANCWRMDELVCIVDCSTLKVERYFRLVMASFGISSAEADLEGNGNWLVGRLMLLFSLVLASICKLKKFPFGLCDPNVSPA